MSAQKYNPKEFEKRWQEKWLSDKLYKTGPINNPKGKYYSLYSYPYPSGSGLHVGHVEGMVANDIMARYYRLKGRSVTLPMGWDAFGLPAENYAIKTGVPPQKNTDDSIKTFIDQINNIGISVDWETEVGSHEQRYYKWTQWIFLELYKAGLAYKKNAPVNWCPKDETVLANEQVVDGKCERCDTDVIQKNMEQWFFKITDFADRLDKDLDKVDWPESTKAQQRNWIGKSVGTEVDFKVQDSSSKTDISKLRIFTTRIDTIFGATFMVIAPEHPLISSSKESIKNWDEIQAYLLDAKKRTELERQTNKDKSGIKIDGLVAINPFNNQETPIFVADYVLMGYGTGAIMAVPAHDDRDFEFAVKYNIEIKSVIKREFNSERWSYYLDKIALQNVGDLIKDLVGKNPLRNKNTNLVQGAELINIKDGVLLTIHDPALTQEFHHLICKIDTQNEFDLTMIRDSQVINIQFSNFKQIITSNKDYEILNYLVPTGRFFKDEFKFLLENTAINDEAIFKEKGTLVNSGEFTELTSASATQKMQEWLEAKELGNKKITYKIRDWLLSRQRYWGAPIPIVYDPEGNPHAIDFKNLPLILPEDVDFKPTGESPIARSESFKKLAEDRYGKGWHFEVDTMDTFVDSSWYFLRYFSVNDSEKIFETPDSSVKLPTIEVDFKGFIQVLQEVVSTFENNSLDYYVFGSTAIAGLNRGFHSELEDIDVFVDNKDMNRIKDIFLNQGFIIKDQHINDFNNTDPIIVFGKDGIEVEIMGFDLTDEYKTTRLLGVLEGVTFKITPIKALYSYYHNRELEDVAKFVMNFDTRPNYWLPTDLYMIGAEHTVLHLLYSRFFTKFLFDKGLINFDEPFYFMRHMGTILGNDSRKMSKRWGNVLNPNDEIEKYGADTLRMYEMFMGPIDEAKPWNDRAENGVFRFLAKVWELQNKVEDYENTKQSIEINKIIKKVSEDIEDLSFNTCVAKFMEFTNFLQKEEKISKTVLRDFVILMAPFAPYITEELWMGLGGAYSVHNQEWPSYNETINQNAKVTIVVQVNGKVRGSFETQSGLEESEVYILAARIESVKKYLVNEPKKVIFIKDRIINFIIN